MLRGIRSHDARAPGPPHQVEPLDSALARDELDRGTDVAHRGIGADDGRILVGRLAHLRGTRRLAVPAQIDEPDVETVLGDVVHPGDAAHGEVESGRGGIGRAVHEEQDARGRELRHSLRVLVAQV